LITTKKHEIGCLIQKMIGQLRDQLRLVNQAIQNLDRLQRAESRELAVRAFMQVLRRNAAEVGNSRFKGSRTVLKRR
jgi:hypothetical protein